MNNFNGGWEDFTLQKKMYRNIGLWCYQNYNPISLKEGREIARLLKLWKQRKVLFFCSQLHQFITLEGDHSLNPAAIHVNGFEHYR